MVFSPILSAAPSHEVKESRRKFMSVSDIRGFLEILSKIGMIGSMKSSQNIPKIVSWIAITLGVLDILRGIIHTLLLNLAATSIAGLDLSTPQAFDLLRLMGVFGISNYITGAALILTGWKARELALILLGLIPAAYLVGGLATRFYSAGFPQTQANWGGLPMMLVYLAVSSLTFMYGIWKRGS